jgi:hypothetical protein
MTKRLWGRRNFAALGMTKRLWGRRNFTALRMTKRVWIQLASFARLDSRGRLSPRSRGWLCPRETCPPCAFIITDSLFLHFCSEEWHWRSTRISTRYGGRS